jgi:hypothetical protein
VNIFCLSSDPVEAAQFECNSHVVKMCVESAQILSTVIFLRDHDAYNIYAPCLYKPTHRHHPCVKWATLTGENFRWLAVHSLALCDEYERRYGKVHASRRVVECCAEFPAGDFYHITSYKHHTPFAQAMPEKYRCEDAVIAYRNYYAGEKARFTRWEPRAKMPSWWQEKNV